MFGIEKLREEIKEIAESLYELKENFKEYREAELTFTEMQTYLNGMFYDFSKSFDEKFKNISKEKDNRSYRVVHDGIYCGACTENAMMPNLPKCKAMQKKEKNERRMQDD